VLVVSFLPLLSVKALISSKGLSVVMVLTLGVAPIF
jgi:hypothetical protein